ncbi:MAG: hypothetical protein Q9169_001611 [Polycauliona sp. 2 TL-2023]
MADSSGDFKWFGEGFEGFPKILPDDCIQYTLYIVDSNLSHLEIRAQLRKVQTATVSLCKDLLKDFIWQRDDFRLELKQKDGLSYLEGRTNFGDSIEDEWLIVYLLRELSKQFPQIWVRVVDSDGEFLLVEAADTLPRWVNPEIMDNRDSLHQSMMTIPRKLAYILHEKAAYISSAVEAFYLRDPIGLRPLQSTGAAKLLFRPEDFVTISTRFTKVGFAQLRGQDFDTPRAWATSIGKEPSILSQIGYQMGMKVTCGFEMLMSDPQNVDKKPVREINLLLEDISAGEAKLPSDQAISEWESRVDDESWLDVDFEEFERELSGKGDQNASGSSAGFADKTAQENLRRMVSRFAKFRDEDDDGIQDGEYVDDMDNDNDSDSLASHESAKSEDDDKEKVDEFDEDRFASMMREMMGLPATGTTDSPPPSMVNEDLVSMSGAESVRGDEAKEFHKVMNDMEAELRDAGALSLEPPQHNKTGHQKTIPSVAQRNGDASFSELSRVSQDQSSSDGESGELDIDFERAKELLSQFKVR